jgi:hypothetical protein
VSEVFTVYFDGQFWVGVLEMHGPDGVRAARHIFGPEPTNPELLEFACRGDFDRLSRRAAKSPPVPARQRALSRKREIENQPVGTAAQRAMKAATAARAAESKTAGRERAELEKDRRRAIARAKAKARHRGR